MKFIVSFLATAFCLGLALAQEETPAPAESAAPTESSAPATEEKASATVETAPAPATSPTTVKKAEAAATAASPAAATKKESPAAATKPAAAPSGKKMTVKEMEDKWEASVPGHDYSTVSGYVSSDFVGVSSRGKFVDKNALLAEYKSDKDTYKSAKNEKLNVKNFGPNVTVVTGRAREIGTGKDGKAFDRTFLFTDTWLLRGGQWQCVASQSTKIKG